MSVIRLRPGEACQEGGGQTGLPHLSLHDCLASLAREMADTLARARQINQTRRKILERRLDGLKHGARKTDLSPRDRKVPHRR
jgi:hypothetical protein